MGGPNGMFLDSGLGEGYYGGDGQVISNQYGSASEGQYGPELIAPAPTVPMQDYHPVQGRDAMGSQAEAAAANPGAVTSGQRYNTPMKSAVTPKVQGGKDSPGMQMLQKQKEKRDAGAFLPSPYAPPQMLTPGKPSVNANQAAIGAAGSMGTPDPMDFSALMATMGLSAAPQVSRGGSNARSMVNRGRMSTAGG